jgi:plastocyanin
MKRLSGFKKRAMINTAILAILLTIGSCSKSNDYSSGPGSTGEPGANEVWIQGMAFTPATRTVTAGTTIKWTNKDNSNHTVTSDVGSSETFDSGTMGKGDTFTWQFSTAGTIKYHCTFHSGMKATVVVN